MNELSSFGISFARVIGRRRKGLAGADCSRMVAEVWTRKARLGIQSIVAFGELG